MDQRDMDLLKAVPQRKPGQETPSDPDPFNDALKEANQLLAKSVVHMAKGTVVNEISARAEGAEAIRLDAEAKKLEALRRKNMAEQNLNPDAAIPEQIRENPSIRASIEALIPIVGETRAKAIVYGGLQQGWQPGAAQPATDPYSEIGKSVFEPVAKAMGENMAASLKKTEGEGGGRPADEAGAKTGPAPFDPEQYFIQRQKELDAVEHYVHTLTQRRQALVEAQGSPAMTGPERTQLGVAITNVDEALRWQQSQWDHDMAMFRLQEESKRQWAQFNIDTERGQNRDRQVGDVVALAKQNLPTAVSAAQALIQRTGRPGAGRTPGDGRRPASQPSTQARMPSEVVAQCPSCSEDTIVPANTTKFECDHCGKTLEVEPD